MVDTKLKAKWTIEYLSDAAIVKATTCGRVTYGGAIAVAADMARHLNRLGAVKFLVDHRSAAVDISITDLYYLVAETERVGLGPQYIGAIVFAKDTEHDFGFYQMRTVNAGFRRRMFTDMQAAMEWLRSV
jgi:hypothetical protein